MNCRSAPEASAVALQTTGAFAKFETRIFLWVETGFHQHRVGILDDPLAALEQWNADPTLAARARTTNGSEYTAVELQLRFLAASRRFVDAGGCNGIVPRASEIVDLWEDTLHKLRQGDFDSLSRRLDWVLKRNMLQRVMSQRSLAWTSPELKHLDQLFASLDQIEGLFWAFERAGAVDRIVDDQSIRRALDNPPDDTRAWTRAQLLRMGADACEEVDWDVIRLRLRPQLGNRSWLERRSVHLTVTVTLGIQWLIRLPSKFGQS